MTKRLRYRISSWTQLPDCLSNNSKNYYITVTDLTQQKDINGLVLTVHHAKYGVLFSAMPDSSGKLISEYDEEGVDIPSMTCEEILTQLKRFGFDIQYNQESSLPDYTLSFLMQLDDLGYSKITRIHVGRAPGKNYVVALKADGNEDIYTFGSSITEAKFNKKLASNNVINITEQKDVTWTWVDRTYNIEDVLQANADIEKHGPVFESTEIDNSGLTEYADEVGEEQTFHEYSDEQVVEEYDDAE